MRKNVLICVLGGKNWLGGIYYIKNLLFQLSISDEAQSKYQYYMLIWDDIIDEFSEFIRSMNIVVITCGKEEDIQEQLLSVCTDYRIDIALPIQGGAYTWLINDISLYWIPDFQEVHLPEKFSSEELKSRKQIRSYIAAEHKGLILSSKDSYNDYINLYPQSSENVFVVHFVSYIQPLIEEMTPCFEKEVMGKFGIKDDYIFVSNQFWKHKNHIVVLEAMNEILNRNEEKIHLVCTGFMESYGKHDEYTMGLLRYVKEHNMQEYVHFLGLLERKEQLCLMKNSRLLIQPSKFEGWGCSVEDGKVMGKEILMSDINVHIEQRYPKSMLFAQEDSKELAALIIEKFFTAQQYDLEYGHRYTMQKAVQYAKELQIAMDSVKIGEKRNYMEELERLRKEKLIQIFGGIPQNQICIYGVGASTQKMAKSYRRIFEKSISVYSDSDEKKWGTDFEGGRVYSPSELLGLGIKRIVISSIRYQEEIYQSLKNLEKDIEIIKIYHSDKEKNEVLWV